MLTIAQAQLHLEADLAVLRQYITAHQQVVKLTPAAQQILDRLNKTAPRGPVVQQANTIINNHGGTVVQNNRRSYSYITEFIRWRDQHFRQGSGRNMQSVGIVPARRKGVWKRYGWIELDGSVVRVTRRGWRCI